MISAGTRNTCAAPRESPPRDAAGRSGAPARGARRQAAPATSRSGGGAPRPAASRAATRRSLRTAPPAAAAARRRFVEGEQLAEEHAHAPAVADDVVHGQQQQVLLVGEAHQRGAEQRTALQVKGALRILPHHAARLVLAVLRREPGEVQHRQLRGRGRVDDLDSALLHRLERGAQRLVAAHQLAQRPLQGGRIEVPPQPAGPGHVVAGVLRVHLVQEPEPLLRKGERQRPRALGRHQRRHHRQLRAAHLLHAPGHLRHRGSLEERPQRHLHAEHLAEPRDHPRAQQRVSAQVQEVVVPAHPLGAEHLGPDRGHRLLRLTHRRFVRTGRIRVAPRRRERLAVHLAVRRQRQRLQRDEGGRDHVLRQAPPQAVAQRLRLRVTHDVRHHPPVARLAVARDDGAVRDAGRLAQRGLDLAQLDAETTDLHLLVQAAQVLHRAVRQPPHPVTRAVQPCAALRREGIGDEALRREGGAVQVPARHLRAADAQLPGHAGRQRPQPRVKHVDARVRDGPADGGCACAVRLHHARRGDDGALGGSVVVRERERQPRGGARPQPVATRQQPPQRRVRRPLQRQQGLSDRGGDEGDGDRVLHQPVAQRRWIGAHPLGHHRHRRAAREVRPHLPHRRVEPRAGHLGRAVRRRHAEGAHVPGAQGAQGRVLHRHALGRAGAPGGVDHVGRVARRHAARQVGRALRRPGVGVPVHPHHVHALLLRRRGAPSARQQHRRAGIAQHQLQPRAGIGGVHRHVRAAGLEDRKVTDDELRTALQAHPHARLRAHAQARQVARQAVGPRVHLCVGEGGGPARDRGGLRCARGLRLEQLVDAPVRRVPGLRPVPRIHHQDALFGREQVQLREPHVRVRGDLLQHPLQVAEHPLDRAPLEEVRAVRQSATHALGGRRQGQGEIEPGTRELRAGSAHLQPRKSAPLVAGVLQREHYLAQGRVAQAAFRLQLGHQLLERHLLVLVRAHRDLPRPPQHLAEARVPREVGAQHHGIDEEADRILDLLRRPPRDRAAHDDVLASAVPGQQHLERAQQRHVQRGALAARQCPQPLQQLRRELHRHGRGTVRLHRRTGMVGGQLQQLRHAGQALPPV